MQSSSCLHLHKAPLHQRVVSRADHPFIAGACDVVGPPIITSIAEAAGMILEPPTVFVTEMGSCGYASACDVFVNLARGCKHAMKKAIAPAQFVQQRVRRNASLSKTFLAVFADA